MVALSGGVDSAAAALLAARRGMQVIGITLDTPGAEPEQAREVCRLLGIEHYEVDVAALFEEQVVGPFVASYASGRTPNPCVVCNPRVKFATLARLADELDCDAIATGHYARIRGEGAEHHLLRALDRGKDQSYVLYHLAQPTLARLMLPLGELTKDEVRDLAHDAGLPTADRPESQDACFAPEGDAGALVEAICPEAGRPGPILDAEGKMLGEHRGLAHYTVGQRRGLGLGGPGGPYYVLRILPEHSALVVGAERELWVDGCELEAVHLVGSPPGQTFDARVMTRYRGTETPAAVELTSEGAVVRFRRPHRAPAPGQSAVFYRGERLVGGGTITPPPA